MKTSDLLLTIFIFFIFIGLNLFTVLVIGIKKIKQDWPLYRCNPAVLPFAGYFGHDVGSNFTYCIQNIQTSFMGELLQPVYYGLNNISELADNLNDSTQAIRALFDKIRTFVSSIVESIMSVFLNILIIIQKTIIVLKDSIGKLAGILTTYMYMLSTTIDIADSAWDGPPGQILRAVCFHPNTEIKKFNNNIIHMKNVKQGDRLKNGQIVYATMNLHNLDENGNYVEKLFSIPNGENNNNIIVSGSHLIFDNNLQKFIQVKDFQEAVPFNSNSKKLVCLITSNHLIPLGIHLFHDWEDNNGSPSKNLNSSNC